MKNIFFSKFVSYKYLFIIIIYIIIYICLCTIIKLNLYILKLYFITQNSAQILFFISVSMMSLHPDICSGGNFEFNRLLDII